VPIGQLMISITFTLKKTVFFSPKNAFICKYLGKKLTTMTSFGQVFAFDIQNNTFNENE
jgi:hypothetical protein